MNRSSFLLSWFLFLVVALPPLLAATSRIYVANNAGTTLDVIDPATNSVVQRIRGIELPEVARFSPDGSRMYITALAEPALLVMDRKTGNRIKKVSLSGLPNDVGVTDNGKLILVCIHEYPGALDLIDANSLEKIGSIPAKWPLHDLDVTADGHYAVAGSTPGKAITVFDLEKKQVAWELPLGGGIGPLAIEPGPNGTGSRIFVDVDGLNGFAVVDFVSHNVEKIKYPDDPTGFPFSGKTAHGLVISPDGKTLWGNSGPADAVFVYSLPDLKLLGHVSMPKLQLPGNPSIIPAGPDWLTFTADSKTVYVSNTHFKSVSAIDARTLKVVAVIPAGERPAVVSTLVIPDGLAEAPAEPVSHPTLDYEFFKARVEPIFLKERSEEHARCYLCHSGDKGEPGKSGPPAYVEHLLPGNTFWTEEQSRRNFQNVLKLVVPGDPMASPILMHPLAPEAGGDARHIHNGGRQFESQNDPDWQTIADWIRGKKLDGSTGQ